MKALSRWRLERARRAAAKTARLDVLDEFYAAPLPPLSTPWHALKLLCVDLETTGLDAKGDAILSIGAIAIEGGAIQMGSATYGVAQYDGVLDDESLALHGLAHDALAQGKPVDVLLGALLTQLTGATMVAHAKSIECTFLDAACKHAFETPFVMETIDTLTIEQRRAARRSGPPASVRLGQSRARYNLPRYKAHHALTDALATAELLLAQIEAIGADSCTLADLL